VLGNRVGDDRAGASGDDIADRVTNRGQRCAGAAVVRQAWPCGRRMAAGYDWQGVGERTDCILGTDVGELDLKSQNSCPVIEVIAIPDQVKRRKLQFIAAQPRHQCDIRPDARGFACGQRKGFAMRQRYSIIAALRISCR